MNIDMTALARQILLDAGFFNLARVELDAQITEATKPILQEAERITALRQDLEHTLAVTLEKQNALSVDISALATRAEDAIAAARTELSRGAEQATGAVATFDQKVAQIHQAAQDDLARKLDALVESTKAEIARILSEAQQQLQAVETSSEQSASLEVLSEVEAPAEEKGDA